MRHTFKIFGCLFLLIFAGCAAEHKPSRPSENGIYYWKTTFNLSDWDKEFLKQHRLGTVYLRLFDVVYDNDFDLDMKPVPNATVRFDSHDYPVLPDSLEIVPVIYITQEAIRHDNDFASVLYERVKNMAFYNDFSAFKEIQLDCDWTKDTRDAFFALCRRLGELLHADSLQLSATIRLHQLRDAAPPVDKGVLMVYNTGSIYDEKSDNSIIDLEHVRPYFRSKVSYPLPLKIAFSTYGWSRVFDNEGNFVCLLHSTEFSDTTVIKPAGKNRFDITDYVEMEGNCFFSGYRIICEYSSISDILAVKKLVYDRITSEIDGNLIYDLDRQSLGDYSAEEINEILK